MFIRINEIIRQVSISACLPFYYLLCIILIFMLCSCTNQEHIIVEDSFEEVELNTSLWDVTESGDFSDKTVDIYDVDQSERNDYRLRISAGTIGTSSQTKILGVRYIEKIDFIDGITIEAELDWNSQRNGSYLSAVFMLSPEILENMDKGADLIVLEYAGVPPGRNIKATMKKKVRRSLQVLFKDWGQLDVLGKSLGHFPGDESIPIKIYIDKNKVQYYENETEKFSLSPHGLNFSSGYFYLQMRSGPNYPVREIYFDNVKIFHGNR